MCKRRTILSKGVSIQWVLVAILVWSGACFGAVSEPSLIGWWRLDEPSGTAARFAILQAIDNMIGIRGILTV